MQQLVVTCLKLNSVTALLSHPLNSIKSAWCRVTNFMFYGKHEEPDWEVFVGKQNY